MIKFNISPSSLKLYRDSPLLFYYQYITKEKPDTKVAQCYGIAGTLIHELLEDVTENRYTPEQAKKQFNTKWDERDLNILQGINGKTLNKNQYYDSLLFGLKYLSILKEQYTTMRSEEKIEFPLINTKDFNIGIKGIVDLQVINNNDCKIIDWKTSTSINESFQNQGLFYAYLIYKKYNIVMNNIEVVYVKRSEIKQYKFSNEDIESFEKELKDIAIEIITKGNDINKYEIGDIDSPFNQHKQKCLVQKNKRQQEHIITITRKNNKLYIINMTDHLKELVKQKYSYLVEGYQFSPKYKSRLWDGKKTLLKRETLPASYLQNFLEFINDYNEHFKKSIKTNIVDERIKTIINKQFTLDFSNSSFDLRDYQFDAVNMAIDKKFGIINIGTGGGKSLIAAEFIKQTKRRTLFLVNRIELVKQTKEVFEDYLGIEIGMMVEGQIDTSKIVTVASIDTLTSILKRGDQTTKDLVIYLHNVTSVIYDECHGCRDVGKYSMISNCLNNLVYSIGLTGTAFRNDNADLEMNALVGFVIYRKSTDELEKKGFLCPTKCYFIDNDIELISKELDGYSDYYKQGIQYNVDRNSIIKDICNHFKGKKILILTKLVNHANDLKDLIDNSEVIIGSTKKSSRIEVFDNFKKSSDMILVGSSKIFSAGINIPDLDVIINASAHKSDIDTLQIIGRVKRKYDNKDFGFYIDFLDNCRFLKSASNQRIKTLKKSGHFVKIIDNISEI